MQCQPLMMSLHTQTVLVLISAHAHSEPKTHPLINKQAKE